MQWYVNTIAHGTEGPFETDEVVRRLRAGEFASDAMVCLKGSADWLEPGKVPALADALAPAPEDEKGPQRHRTVLEFSQGKPTATASPVRAPAVDAPGAVDRPLSHAPPKPRRLPPPPPRVVPAPPARADGPLFTAAATADGASTEPGPEASLSASIDSILEQARRAPPAVGEPSEDPTERASRPVELDAGELIPLAGPSVDRAAAETAKGGPPGRSSLKGGRDPRKLMLVVAFGALAGLGLAVLLVALTRGGSAPQAAPAGAGAHAASAPSAVEPPVASASVAQPEVRSPAPSTRAMAGAYRDQAPFRAAAAQANFGMTPATFAALERAAGVLETAPEWSDEQLASAHTGCVAPRLAVLAKKSPDDLRAALAGAATAQGELSASTPPADDAERAARVRALQGAPLYVECVLRVACATLRSRRPERSGLIGTLDPDAVPVFTGLLCDARFPEALGQQLAAGKTAP